MTVRVLILEANPVARRFLGRVVRESFSDALAVVEVGDADAAWHEIAAASDASTGAGEGYRLLLVDLELRDGSGLELLARLAGHPATKVVTTLHSDDEHLFPALQCGADGYLLKEDRFEVLVEELQKIVRGPPPLSPAIARRMLAHFRVGALPPAPGDAPRTAPVPLQAPSGDNPLSAANRLTPAESEVLTYLS